MAGEEEGEGVCWIYLQANRESSGWSPELFNCFARRAYMYVDLSKRLDFISLLIDAFLSVLSTSNVYVITYPFISFPVEIISSQEKKKNRKKIDTNISAAPI